MFTGIVEELGTVKSKRKQSGNMRFSVEAADIVQDCRIGDSICVNGVCLTVVKILNSVIEFDVLTETVNRSNLGLLKTGNKVNLERSLKVGQRLSGHFVSGHVDGMGVIKYRKIESGDLVLGIEVAEELFKFVSLKGSVAVDGISLTVSACDRTQCLFQVNIIPHTAKITTLGLVCQADKVNIEVDMFARYIYNFLCSDEKKDETLKKMDSSSMTKKDPGLTAGYLTKHGFM